MLSLHLNRGKKQKPARMENEKTKRDKGVGGIK